MTRLERVKLIGHNQASIPIGKSRIMFSFKISQTVSILCSLVIVSGCSGMSEQDKSTAVGAGAGALGGAVLTGGSPIGTVGGAAVGGYIGHETQKSK